MHGGEQDTPSEAVVSVRAMVTQRDHSSELNYIVEFYNRVFEFGTRPITTFSEVRIAVHVLMVVNMAQVCILGGDIHV